MVIVISYSFTAVFEYLSGLGGNGEFVGRICVFFEENEFEILVVDAREDVWGEYRGVGRG